MQARCTDCILPKQIALSIRYFYNIYLLTIRTETHVEADNHKAILVWLTRLTLSADRPDTDVHKGGKGGTPFPPSRHLLRGMV